MKAHNVKQYLWTSLLACCLLSGGLLVRNCEHVRIDEERLHDVQLLMLVHKLAEEGNIEGRSNIEFEALRKMAADFGGLYSPIPIDASRSCYRYGRALCNDGSLPILIEENDNVRDTSFRVRGYAGGGVCMERADAEGHRDHDGGPRIGVSQFLLRSNHMNDTARDWPVQQ